MPKNRNNMKEIDPNIAHEAFEKIYGILDSLPIDIFDKASFLLSASFAIFKMLGIDNDRIKIYMDEVINHLLAGSDEKDIPK